MNNTNLKFLIVLLLALLKSGTDLQAQQLPQFTPPSPVASQFQRYLGYPISPATGLADITIPLYNLKVSGFSMPMSLKYHGDGIKVGQSPGNIGFGWSLFPGNMITRTIMGNPDDVCKTDAIPFGGYFSNTSHNLLVDMCPPLGSPDSPINDGQYDIFTIHLPNINGTFILQWENGVLKATNLPSSTIKIVPVLSPSSYLYGFFYGFEVFDEQGIKYSFGPATQGDPSYTESTDLSNYHANTSYLLRKITLPGINNEITFNYDVAGTMHFDQPNQSITVLDNAAVWGSARREAGNFEYPLEYAPDVGGPYKYTSASVNGPINPNYDLKALKSIQFPNGKVQFTYTDGYNYLLSDFKVYDSQSRLIKTCSFTRQANVGYTGLLLSKVTISGDGEYTFQYNDKNITNLYGVDFSGYYNGKPNTSPIPLTELSMKERYYPYFGYNHLPRFQPFGNADRKPDSIFMKARILEKITYPTGGWTSFQYEPHQFISKGILDFGLGLRVKTVHTFDPVGGKTLTKSYKYGQNESGLGNLGMPVYRNGQISAIDELSFVKETWILKEGGQLTNKATQMYRSRTLSSDNQYTSFNFNTPVWYDEVTEYSDGGKIRYNYDYQGSTFVNAANPSPSAGTINLYPGYMGAINLEYEYNDYTPDVLRFGSVPQLKKKQVYDGVGNLLEEEINTYSVLIPTVTNVLISPSVLFGYTDSYQEISNTNIINRNNIGYIDYQIPSIKPFKVNNFKMAVGKEVLLTSNMTDFRNGLQVNKTNAISYDGTFNITLKSTTGSNNETLTENYYYPTSPVIPGLTSQQQSMVAMLSAGNRLTSLVKKTSYKNTTPIATEQIDYKDWGNNVITPEVISTQKGTGNLIPRIKYHSYDNTIGNVLSVSKEGAPKVSYQWGYNKQYPVAQATGTSEKNIFFESFEEGSGNVANTTHTGHYYYNGTFTKMLINLDNGSYVLSYWLKQAGNWALQNTTVQVAAGSYTISLSGELDDIRFYPQGVQMNTYTYDPLIGVTSMTNAMNQTVYYEYDSSQRLIIMRDKDRHIVKQYCYNYAGQQTNCTVTTPNWQNTATTIRCKVDGNGHNTGEQEQEQKDTNTASPTYNQLRWVVVATNTTSCPVDNCATCTDFTARCINGICEYGVLVYTASIRDESSGDWACYFHYEYSDGSWSDTYTSFGNSPCF